MDTKATWSSAKQLHSYCGWTPFEGFQATGKVLTTVLRGQVVAKDGQSVGKSRGVPVKFTAVG